MVTKKKSTVKVFTTITIANSGAPENAQIQPCNILKVGVSRKSPNLISIKVKPRHYRFMKKGSISLNAIRTYLKENDKSHLIDSYV
jgi:hypothetical protein